MHADSSLSVAVRDAREQSRLDRLDHLLQHQRRRDHMIQRRILHIKRNTMNGGVVEEYGEEEEEEGVEMSSEEEEGEMSKRVSRVPSQTRVGGEEEEKPQDVEEKDATEQQQQQDDEVALRVMLTAAADTDYRARPYAPAPSAVHVTDEMTLSTTPSPRVHVPLMHDMHASATTLMSRYIPTKHDTSTQPNLDDIYASATAYAMSSRPVHIQERAAMSSSITSRATQHVQYHHGHALRSPTPSERMPPSTSSTSHISSLFTSHSDIADTTAHLSTRTHELASLEQQLLIQQGEIAQTRMMLARHAYEQREKEEELRVKEEEVSEVHACVGSV